MLLQLHNVLEKKDNTTGKAYLHLLEGSHSARAASAMRDRAAVKMLYALAAGFGLGRVQSLPNMLHQSSVSSTRGHSSSPNLGPVSVYDLNQ